MFDASRSIFQPYPTGPFESKNINGQDSAQPHYLTDRQIKIKDPHGLGIPNSSYVDHYPPKPLPEQELAPSIPTKGAPFTAQSTYSSEHYPRPFMPRPATPLAFQPPTTSFVNLRTTNQHFYKPYELPPPPSAEAPSRPITAPCNVPQWDTTYTREFPPKPLPPPAPITPAPPHQLLASMADGTTYGNHYIPHPLVPVPRGPAEIMKSSFPFTGISEFMAEFIPKQAYPLLPPLTGTLPSAGLTLPLPRRSLGVQYKRREDTDRFYVLIPRTADAPCAARQVFTTVIDNQAEASILVLYGDDPVASKNAILGQFDIVRIPPAPRDVPRIEVIFRLSADMRLTAEARDLDTDRHKMWIQGGEDIVVLKM